MKRYIINIINLKQMKAKPKGKPVKKSNCFYYYYDYYIIFSKENERIVTNLLENDKENIL